MILIDEFTPAHDVFVPRSKPVIVTHLEREGSALFVRLYNDQSARVLLQGRFRVTVCRDHLKVYVAGWQEAAEIRERFQTRLTRADNVAGRELCYLRRVEGYQLCGGDGTAARLLATVARTNVASQPQIRRVDSGVYVLIFDHVISEATLNMLRAVGGISCTAWEDGKVIVRDTSELRKAG